jgi:glutamate N-acetyltransferase/amino-acid N-acetyltransferase
MSSKISPLAPKEISDLAPISGVRLASMAAGIRYKNRTDLIAIVFDRPAQVAGVFTKSKCPSAPVDWCRKNLTGGVARCVIVNSGNANAFTGAKGAESVRRTAEAAKAALGCRKREVFVASTGVIGEPLDASRFGDHLQTLAGTASETAWLDAAKAIMTTDTFPKLATRAFKADGKTYRINGMAKGAGMMAPDMATMLSFVVTDFPASSRLLQKLLADAVGPTFNSITVDSDTSTSDTLLLFALPAAGAKLIADSADKRIPPFAKALREVLHELAMLVVRDGEGATKHVEIRVKGAKSDKSAKRVALSVANSPLVKTAIAGEDANWGRIVMAIGKAGEPADRDRISIWFGDIRVARRGYRDPGYDETAVTAQMKKDFIPITIDLGVGGGDARVWTCDLTHEYVAINGDYRS